MSVSHAIIFLVGAAVALVIWLLLCQALLVSHDRLRDELARQSRGQAKAARSDDQAA